MTWRRPRRAPGREAVGAAPSPSGRKPPATPEREALNREALNREALGRNARSPSPWWEPDVHADRRPFLLARNRIVAALRGFFAEGGFVEAEPACLQVSPGNEAHLHAFATEALAPDGGRQPLYLHTSPEFALK